MFLIILIWHADLRCQVSRDMICGRKRSYIPKTIPGETMTFFVVVYDSVYGWLYSAAAIYILLGGQ